MFPYTDQNVFRKSFTDDDQNPNSSSFLHFPSPFLDHDDLLVHHFLLSQQQFLAATASAAAQAESENIGMADSTNATNINNDTPSNVASDAVAPKKVAAEQKLKKVVPKKRNSSSGANKQTCRKRTGKKDRHSKIYTAQGLRDRRMRLSLQIARKFFDLQDMLGFDKASKTIEWLFTMSKAAIKELTANLPQMKHSGGGGGKNAVSSTSEWKEVVPETKETGYKGGINLDVPCSEKKNRKSRNAACDPLAKQSREMARARARERTRERMMIRSLEKSKQHCSEKNPNNLKEVGSSSPFETGEESAGSQSQEMNSSLEVVAKVEEPSNHSSQENQMAASIIEKFLGMTSTPRVPSVFNYSCNVAVSSGVDSNDEFPCFPADWEIDNARIHSNYCAMTSIHPSTGNAQQTNPSSSFMNASNIFLQSQFQGNQVSCNPLGANTNQSLY